MSISTRWVEVEVKVIANAGEQEPPYFEHPATLVQIEYSDNQKRRWVWAEFLRATEGWPEIQSAYRSAPEVELDESGLVAAFLEAE